MVKRLFLDLETTGLDPKKCAITQIAAFAQTPERNDVFMVDIRPFDGATISPKALQVQGISKEELFTNERTDYPQTHIDFIGFLRQFIDPYDHSDKFHLIGYNIGSFDVRFLRELFNQAKDRYFNSYFFHPPIDVMYLAAQHLVKERGKMENFKLATVGETMKIPFDPVDLHSALGDVKLTKDIYEKITKG